ncbi:hypothetical protein D3C71_1876380 [compost metagenome]
MRVHAGEGQVQRATERLHVHQQDAQQGEPAQDVQHRDAIAAGDRLQGKGSGVHRLSVDQGSHYAAALACLPGADRQRTRNGPPKRAVGGCRSAAITAAEPDCTQCW